MVLGCCFRGRLMLLLRAPLSLLLDRWAANQRSRSIFAIDFVIAAAAGSVSFYAIYGDDGDDVGEHDPVD